MSRNRFLIDPFARLRAVIAVTGAALLAGAVLVAAPPHLFAQDPAIEDVAPDDPAEEATEPEDATPEDVAPEEVVPDEVAPEEAAPEEAAPEEAAPEEAAPEAAEQAEEEKPWDVAAPCENYQHPYEADLCQQWRTAQAAEETAAATKRTAGLARLLMLLGALATLLLLLMFIPLFMAARAARRAAHGTSPVAAPSHGEDREDAVRAYVDVDKLEFIETPESEGVVKVKVVFRNTGRTPAFKTRSTTQVSVHDVSDEDMIPTMPLPDRAKNAARPRLGRDATAVDIVECDSTASLADRVMNGDASIVVWGFAEYMDVFDRQRKTVFQYLCNADTLDTGVIFKPMVRGDEER